MQFEQYTEAEIFIIKVSNIYHSVYTNKKLSMKKKKTQYEK